MTTNALAALSQTQLAAIGNLKQGLANVNANLHPPGGEPILRLGRDGLWVYGAENVEDEEGALWAFNPFSFRHGWICWKVIPNGSKDTPELYGEELVPMNATPPDRSKLQAYDKNGQAVDHTKHSWEEVVAVDVKCIKGSDKGTQVVYKPSSTGGLRAIKELLAKISEQADTDPLHVCPVVTLESDWYNNKTYGGKTYFPVLPIKEWIGIEGPVAAAPAPAVEQQAQEGFDVEETGADNEPTPAPARGRRRGAAAAPQAEPEDAEVTEVASQQPPAGERRRRRRA